MSEKSLHILMVAARRYASSRSLENRLAMLAVGSVLWEGFPDFLMEVKKAIQSGQGREFLRRDDIKCLYALVFMGALNGLEANSLNKVGGTLLDATSRTQPPMAG